MVWALDEPQNKIGSSAMMESRQVTAIKEKKFGLKDQAQVVFNFKN